MRCLTGCCLCSYQQTHTQSDVSVPAHTSCPPTPLHANKKAFGCLLSKHETLPCPKSWTLLQPRAPALRVNIIHMTEPSGPPWPGLQDPTPAGSRSVCRCLVLAFSIPRHVSLLCRVTLIYTTVWKRKIGLSDSTRYLIPALKSDSRQRRLQANVTAAASAHGGQSLT